MGVEYKSVRRTGLRAHSAEQRGELRRSPHTEGLVRLRDLVAGAAVHGEGEGALAERLHQLLIRPGAQVVAGDLAERGGAARLGRGVGRCACREPS